MWWSETTCGISRQYHSRLVEVGGRSQQVSEAGRLGGEGKAGDGSMVVEKSFGGAGEAEPVPRLRSRRVKRGGVENAIMLK